MLLVEPPGYHSVTAALHRKSTTMAILAGVKSHKTHRGCSTCGGLLRSLTLSMATALRISAGTPSTLRMLPWSSTTFSLGASSSSRRIVWTPASSWAMFGARLMYQELGTLVHARGTREVRRQSYESGAAARRTPHAARAWSWSSQTYTLRASPAHHESTFSNTL